MCRKFSKIFAKKQNVLCVLRKKVAKIGAFFPLWCNFAVVRRILYIFIYMATLLCSVVARAEGGDVLRLEGALFNFGQIAEEGGAVQHTVRYRNISSRPVVILAVQSSCGCTTAEFSRKPILPDEDGEIVVRFAPLNQAGRVFRRLVVRTSEGSLEQMITVEGRVTPRVKSLEEQFPIVLCGGVRLDTNAHAFGYVEHGKPTRSTFDIVNTSRREVSLALRRVESSGALRIDMPKSLAAGERATIEFGYELAEGSSLYGTLKDVVHLIINGEEARTPLVINAIAIDSRETFSDIEEPIGELSDNFIKFGSSNAAAEPRVRLLTLCNRGVAPLVIRKVEVEGSFFEAEVEGARAIAAGECREVVVRLTPPSDMLGAVSGRLKIITNAPRRPLMNIRVTAIIERE